VEAEKYTTYAKRLVRGKVLYFLSDQFFYPEKIQERRNAEGTKLYIA
jgi:hypothetical protein